MGQEGSRTEAGSHHQGKERPGAKCHTVKEGGPLKSQIKVSEFDTWKIFKKFKKNVLPRIHFSVFKGKKKNS